MSLPTVEVDGHATTVYGDDMTLWFSYATLVAFRIGSETVVSENKWSKTTGKHLNAIDGNAKEKRLPYDEFVRKYQELTARHQPSGLFG